jgi:hypothetical protein
MSTDVLDRLREAHAAVPAPEAASTAAARARLDAAIAARARRRRGAALPVRRVLVIAAALAVAAVIAVALVPTRVGGPAHVTPGPAPAVASACLAGPSASAGSCLQALGAVAGAQRLPADGVRYVRNHWLHALAHFGPAGSGVPANHVTKHRFDLVRWTSEELWLAADGSGRLAYGNDEPPVLPTSADRRAWLRSGSPDLARLFPPADQWGPKVTRFSAHQADGFLLGSGELYSALPKGHPLKDMPRDPSALRRYLMRTAWYQRTKISGEGPCAPDLHDCSAPTRRNIRSMFGSDILTLLRYPYTPPALRHSLFAVLSGLPRTRLLGPVRDPDGRRAVAIQIPKALGDGLDIVAFDPRRATLIAIGASDAPRSPEIRWSTLYAVRSAVVGKVGERPRR